MKYYKRARDGQQANLLANIGLAQMQIKDGVWLLSSHRP